MRLLRFDGWGRRCSRSVPAPLWPRR